MTTPIPREAVEEAVVQFDRRRQEAQGGPGALAYRFAPSYLQSVLDAHPNAQPPGLGEETRKQLIVREHSESWPPNRPQSSKEGQVGESLRPQGGTCPQTESAADRSIEPQTRVPSVGHGVDEGGER